MSIQIEKITFTLPHCPICEHSHKYTIPTWKSVTGNNPPRVYNKTLRCPVGGRLFKIGIEEAR